MVNTRTKAFTLIFTRLPIVFSCFIQLSAWKPLRMSLFVKETELTDLFLNEELKMGSAKEHEASLMTICRDRPFGFNGKR